MASADLIDGFQVYIADNVLVMLVATTAGTLGANLFSSSGFPAWIIQVLGMLFNLGLALVLYFGAVARFYAADQSASEAAPTSTRESQNANYQSMENMETGSSNSRPLMKDMGTDATKSAYSHILQMLPWVIIVPMVNIPISISDWLWQFYKSEPHFGNLFAAHFVMSMAFLWAAITLAPIYAAQPDASSKCETLPTFLLNSINHSALSCAGKSLHLLENVMFSSVVGRANDSSKGYLRARCTESIILLALTWFLLAHCWPRLSDATQEDKLFKSLMTTITVYSWAFMFINQLWEFFYTDVPHGQLIYWVIMGACLMASTCLAWLSENNFYGGPSRMGKAFGLMLCWVVDFGVWWGWSQVMTNVDAAAVPDGRAINTALVNGAILIGLIAVTSLLYVYADLKSLIKHRMHRNQLLHGMSKGKASAN